MFFESGFVQQHLWGLPQRGLEAVKLTAEAERCRSQLPPNCKFINSFSFTAVCCVLDQLSPSWSWDGSPRPQFVLMLLTCLWERGSKRERERELAFSRAGVHLIPFDTSVLFLQIASVVCSLEFHKESIFFFPSAVGDFQFTWSARPVSQCYGTHECFVFRILERVTYPIQFTAKSQRFNDSWRLRGLPSGSGCLISQNPVLKRQTMGSLFDSLFICEGPRRILMFLDTKV